MSIWVFAIPAAIVLLLVGTLDSGAGAIAAPGAVSSTGIQQSGSTTAIGGPVVKNDDDACFVLSAPMIACDCSNIYCRCEDRACAGNRKFCNHKHALMTLSKGYLVAIRVKKHCFTIYQCKPEDELDSRSSCGPGNPCMADYDSELDKSETTYYDYKPTGNCEGIPTAP